MASTLDERSVYLSRAALGKELALQEQRLAKVPLDDDTIVVPVPDTGKAAADAMAFALGLPSVEGLMRNRYIGRTFIEGTNRGDRVRMFQDQDLLEEFPDQVRLLYRMLDERLERILRDGVGAGEFGRCDPASDALMIKQMVRGFLDDPEGWSAAHGGKVVA